MERFRYKSFTIGRYKNDFGNFYLIEPIEEKENTFKIDGFTIPRDIRDSFTIPIVFENYKGLYVKTKDKELSFSSDKSSNVKCGPLFYLSETLYGNKIDLSGKFEEYKKLYEKYGIEPTGKYICLTENPNSIKWNKNLLLSQINVLPETYKFLYESDDGILIYVIEKPLPLISKIQISEINEKIYITNEILLELSKEKACRLLGDVEALYSKIKDWVFYPNPDIINIETNIMEFTRKILSI